MSRILLSHGAGGGLTRRLIEDVFKKELGQFGPESMDDAALIGSFADGAAFTTDSFVVKPLFFPGGDIGRLSVCGTVNDLCMKGALPGYLTAGFIIEEGFEIDRLIVIVRSMAKACCEAGVRIYAADTKVVERGFADGLFINTSGVGKLRPGVEIAGVNARAGDKVLVSGCVGNHGSAIMLARGGLPFSSGIESDAAPLTGLVDLLLDYCPGVRVLRDPTRGGLATVLDEIAGQSGVGIVVEEEEIPVDPAVASVCDLLGLDPLYMANEGKLVAVIPSEAATGAVELMRSHPLGRCASIIGEVTDAHPGQVRLRTRVGGTRILDVLAGEPIPRIC